MNGSMYVTRHLGRAAAVAYLSRCEQEQQREYASRRRAIQGFVLMGILYLTASLAFALPG